MASSAAPYDPDLSVPMGRTDGIDTDPASPELEATELEPVYDAPRHRLEPVPDESYGGPKVLTAARRRWAYTVIAAALPLLVLYGVVSAEQAAAWAGVAAGVLGLGLAASRTTDD